MLFLDLPPRTVGRAGRFLVCPPALLRRATHACLSRLFCLLSSPVPAVRYYLKAAIPGTGCLAPSVCVPGRASSYLQRGRGAISCLQDSIACIISAAFSFISPTGATPVCSRLCRNAFAHRLAGLSVNLHGRYINFLASGLNERRPAGLFWCLLRACGAFPLRGWCRARAWAEISDDWFFTTPFHALT